MIGLQMFLKHEKLKTNILVYFLFRIPVSDFLSMVGTVSVLRSLMNIAVACLTYCYCFIQVIDTFCYYKYYSLVHVVLHKIQKQPQGVHYKKGVLRNFAKFTGKHLCSEPQACNFIKKETQAQVLSCKFCKIFKNIFWMLLFPSGKHHFRFKKKNTKKTKKTKYT